MGISLEASQPVKTTEIIKSEKAPNSGLPNLEILKEQARTELAQRQEEGLSQEQMKQTFDGSVLLVQDGMGVNEFKTTILKSSLNGKFRVEGSGENGSITALECNDSVVGLFQDGIFKAGKLPDLVNNCDQARVILNYGPDGNIFTSYFDMRGVPFTQGYSGDKLVFDTSKIPNGEGVDNEEEIINEKL